jgi:hypothetical protein
MANLWDYTRMYKRQLKYWNGEEIVLDDNQSQIPCFSGHGLNFAMQLIIRVYNIVPDIEGRDPPQDRGCRVLKVYYKT